jgi:hypothetical protein
MLDDIELYLPKYLSPGSEDNLFAELEHFPKNVDDRFYIEVNRSDELIYQGDGLTDLLLFSLPDTKSERGRAIVLSNTCDISPSNIRLYPSRFCYAPILNVRKFIEALRKKFPNGDERIGNFEASLRRQSISSAFFLPKGANLDEDSLVFFDRIISIANRKDFYQGVGRRRLFTLSNYGYYILLIKLSIHFCRMADSVDRGLPGFERGTIFE